ncbi:MAG: HAD hydrolase family protein [Ignavibacteriales bacterium]|nr:HAD hydrolase family protein [Ignavibacteriales bacterium]
MVNLAGLQVDVDEAKARVKQINLLLSDNDGVLTDAGVYYSPNGEELKKYSLRDGMGFERVRQLAEIECGIVTRENSPIVQRRAEKLKLEHVKLGVMDKNKTIEELLASLEIGPENLAYIGDDYNDLDAITMAGFSACPSDAMPAIRNIVDYVCPNSGGGGAFRDFAELLIFFKTSQS